VEWGPPRRRRNGLAGIEEGPAMKTLIVVVGTIILLVLLTSGGVLGGAICLENVGCIRSEDNGIKVDTRESVTVSTGNP
jgi:hypothetical protein